MDGESPIKDFSKSSRIALVELRKGEIRMKFQVNAPNLENMQQYLSNEKTKSSSGDGKGPKWWSIPAGMSSIRILPPWDPKGMVALPVHMHPIEYQEKDMKYKKYNWTCVQETFGKPCKICEGLWQLKNAGVDVSKYEASRRQFYMNAIVMYDPTYQADINAGKKPEDARGVAPGTHVLMRVPKTLYDWILSQITNPMVGDITSLTNGIDIYVTKEGTGLGTSYTPTLSPNGRTPVPQEYLDKIESLYNLDEVFSTGFDDDLIDRLVTHLKTSAGVIQQSVPNVVTGMAGYPNTPVAPATPATPPMNNVGVNPMNAVNQNPQVYPTNNMMNPLGNQSPMAPVAPNPFGGNPVAPNPFGTGAPVNFQTPVSSPTMMTSPSNSQVNPKVEVYQPPMNTPTGDNTPNCYGNYDPSNVTCVVCPFEVDCSSKSRK